MKRRIIVLLLCLLAPIALASAHITAEAKISGVSKVGDNVLELRLKGHDGKPLTGAQVKLQVQMVEMDHGTAEPVVTEIGEGLYTATVRFAMKGKWRVTVNVSATNEEPLKKSFEFNAGDAGPMDQGHGEHGSGNQMDHDMQSMKGRLGDWMMSKEGSGTSWMPESSPMHMKSLGNWSGFDVSLMGVASVNYSDAGGRRGESQVFSNSMAMVMGRKEVGRGTLGYSTMFALDPLFNGKKGYPNLFQTGETANGLPLQDRQHPHDVLAELAATYSHPIGTDSRVFIYGGPVGEPALGGPMFLHRASGMENPEAPISHHWFDSSHITFGVITAGVNFGQTVQIEGSWFNGREPDENRYDIDRIQLNSTSGRISYNPNRDWSFQVSYGFLKNPEVLEPGEDQHRLTASAIYSRALTNGDHFAATGFFGRNIKDHSESDALGVEATYFRGPTSFFGRFERVEKDELVNVPEGTYTIDKLIVGATHDLVKRNGFDFGLGGFVGVYGIPDSLKPFYGGSPVSFGVFLRIRPSKMDHDMGHMSVPSDREASSKPARR